MTGTRNHGSLADAPALAAGAGPDVRGHIPALDGLRGLAILLVLWCHLTVMSVNTTFDRVYGHFAGLGWLGVDLFFVLSGFLITGILIDSRSRENYFRNYYIRRVLRIFPLYYAVVFICLVLLPIFPHPKVNNFGRIAGDEWYYWLHLSNISIARAGQYRHGILDVSWSLAIEEQFYLVWPAIVYFCSTRLLKRICIAMLFIAFASRAAMTWWIAPDNHIAPYVLTPCRIDSLGWGALVAVLAREPGGLLRLAPYARRFTAPLLAIAVGITWLELLDSTYDVEKLGIGNGHYSLTFMYSLTAPGFAGLLVLSCVSMKGQVLNGIMTSRFMRTFGKYSYALYLFHMPLRALVRDTIYGPGWSSVAKVRFFTLFGSELPGQALFYVIGLAPAMVAAWLSWRFFEGPILSLKRLFPSGSHATPSAAAPSAEALPAVAQPSPAGIGRPLPALAVEAIPVGQDGVEARHAAGGTSSGFAAKPTPISEAPPAS